MKNAREIRRFLLRKPRPTAVRLQIGRESRVLTALGQTLSQLAHSISAFGPDRIECLDGLGITTRAASTVGIVARTPREVARARATKQLEARVARLISEQHELAALVIALNVRVRELISERVQKGRVEPGVYRRGKKTRL